MFQFFVRTSLPVRLVAHEYHVGLQLPEAGDLHQRLRGRFETAVTLFGYADERLYAVLVEPSRRLLAQRFVHSLRVCTLQQQPL